MCCVCVCVLSGLRYSKTDIVVQHSIWCVRCIHSQHVHILRYSSKSKRMSKNEKDCWVFGHAIELARTRESSVCSLSPYRIFKFSFAFWMAVRMYCAPPTKIDSILRCLETLCDFASVSTYTTLSHNTQLPFFFGHSLSHSLHSLAHSLSLYQCRKMLDTEAERLMLLLVLPLFFRGGWTKFITTRVSITRKPYTYSHYTTSIYLELLNGEWANESYLANLYAHGPRHLYTRACTHWTIHCSVTIFLAKCHLYRYGTANDGDGEQNSYTTMMTMAAATTMGHWPLRWFGHSFAHWVIYGDVQNTRSFHNWVYSAL